MEWIQYLIVYLLFWFPYDENSICPSFIFFRRISNRMLAVIRYQIALLCQDGNSIMSSYQFLHYKS